MQPKDTGLLVDVANAIADVARTIAFVQLPVPIERGDDAYFEPLQRLALHPGTTLFLGLVHYIITVPRQHWARAEFPATGRSFPPASANNDGHWVRRRLPEPGKGDFVPPVDQSVRV